MNWCGWGKKAAGTSTSDAATWEGEKFKGTIDGINGKCLHYADTALSNMT